MHLALTKTTRRPLRPRLAPLFALFLAASGCAAGMPEAAMAPAADYAAPAAPPMAEPGAMPAAMPAQEALAAMPAGMPAASAPVAPGAPAPAPATPSRAKTTGAQGATLSDAAGDKRGADAASARSSSALIIYQGNLQMAVEQDRFPATLDAIIDIAEAAGGHLAGRKDDNVSIRVPSARFRETLTQIDKLGGVVHRSVTADDVSEEFHDIEVRLQNLRATRQRLQEFMAKAGGIQDLLTVERELERVAQEIDRLEGRMRFLRERAALSLITVALQPKQRPVVVVAPPPPPPAAARSVDLPVDWFANLGLNRLLNLR